MLLHHLSFNKSVHHICVFLCLLVCVHSSLPQSGLHLPTYISSIFCTSHQKWKRENWKQKAGVTRLIRWGQMESHSSWQHTWTFNYTLHKAIKTNQHYPACRVTCNWDSLCLCQRAPWACRDGSTDLQVGNYNWSFAEVKWLGYFCQGFS